MDKVIVLTGQSLLTQGIVSNLRGSSHAMEVEAIEINRTDLIETLAALQPSIVILESSQRLNVSNFSLQTLFEVLPNLIVLEVNLNNSSIRLIRSNLYDASGFASLLNVIDNVRINLPDVFSSTPTMQHE